MPFPLLAAGAVVGKQLLGGLIKKGVGQIGGRTIVGRALTAAGVGSVGYALAKKTSAVPSSLPALPGISLPRGVIAPTGGAAPGILPRGPGGKLQFPWNDPRVPEFLRQFSLDDSYMRGPYYRCPRGYVQVEDPSGRKYPIMKSIAIKFGLYREPAKPPISARDWKAYRRNKQIEKMLIRIAKPALHKHATRYVVGTSKKKGKVC